MAMTGTVKFFNGERGYGFIKPDDGGRDVFVHITAVERAGLKDLTEGQRISFEVEPDKKGKGPKAVNLVISIVALCLAHDLRANALRLSRRKTAARPAIQVRGRLFPDHALKKSRPPPRPGVTIWPLVWA